MKNEKWKLTTGKFRVCFLIMLVIAAGFRIGVAHWLPNDAPDDGRVYAQIARNTLEQHVYSHDAAAPFSPSLIRLPGYPFFLASIYSIFGHTNNGAVRVAQALIDAGTCALIGLLAFLWQPDEKRKLGSALAALVLAAICPFTTIYAATILTEVPTNFLIMAMLVAVTFAFRQEQKSRAWCWWIAAGLLGGIAVSFRPDNGLFVAAVGLTLVLTNIWSATSSAAPAEAKRRRRFALPAHFKRIVARTFLFGVLFSAGFALVLTPWTIRNWRVFHVFQPLAPAHAEMPGEFVPRGYSLWVRTWLDDESYVAPFLWALDDRQISIEDVPVSAFDSEQEKAQVAALLDRYNHPPGDEENEPDPSSQPGPTPSPQPTPLASPSPKAGLNSNSNVQGNTDENDTSSDESDNEDEADDESGNVEMTPDIDAGFAQIAHERIASHPFRYYVWVPLKRARTMWFDTHSQYWPFEGTLLPLDDLDYEHHQQYWLPLFAALTAFYSLLGIVGGWFLWRSRNFAARRCLLLAVLAITLRLILFSSLENPEPRYVVEFFPFLSILGGIAIARIATRGFRTASDADRNKDSVEPASKVRAREAEH